MPDTRSDRLFDVVSELARRPGHEQVRTLVSQLLTDYLGAEIHSVRHEVRIVEARGRIDALLGRTIIEFKSNLARERRDAEEELSRYLPEREAKTGDRYIAVATDGMDWLAFEWRSGHLEEVKAFKTNPDQPEALLSWLDGAVATRAEIVPDVLNVANELGQDSIAFRRAIAELRAAWASVRGHPTASLQNQLWSRLLTLVYGRDIENETLWLQHTFLVIVAKAIAARVLDVESDDPHAILDGRAFRQAQIYGAVESDFFDWILLADGGPTLVRRIARHVGRFRLRDVKTDVMKLLYESLIDREQRHGLGEYYTPDWLAAKVVRRAVDDPVAQKVLDPACGSGAFLFHAVRAFVRSAAEGGMAENELASEACNHVAGLDIHPVAVIIARVTFLLALLPALQKREGAVSIPVYLGDALQLDVREYMRQQELSILVPPKPGENGQAIKAGSLGGTKENGSARLTFPEILCRDAPLFDKLIEAMRESGEAAEKPDAFRSRAGRILEQHYRRDAKEAETVALDDLKSTYATYLQLKRAGRNSIWIYVARNLARPLAYGAFGGWANVVVGNPPWLAFRHMTDELQVRFKDLARDHGIYEGGKLTTQNDLCALFMVRCVGLYLRAGGRIAMVLPLAVLTRGQYAKLRSGTYTKNAIAFEEAWTMDDKLQPLFPVPSCVVFGRRRATGVPVPSQVTAFSGTLPFRDAPEEIADRRLRVDRAAPAPSEAKVDPKERKSPYQSAFRQGATLVPRMLCLVERKAVGKLGGAASKPLVASRRGAQDKKPWRDLRGLEHAVEREFVRPVLLGESILPFRVWRPFEAVLPLTKAGELMNAGVAANRGFAGAAAWMRDAEKLWKKHSDSDMTLTERWNYHNELGSQFPVAPVRVIFAASGNHPASAVLRGNAGVIEHKLYWASIESEEEAVYLAAILTSEETRTRVEHLQSRGQFGARDFDKVMFTLPIPRFDPKNKVHLQLAKLGKDAERCAAAVLIPDGEGFQRARGRVREALAKASIAAKIDAAVRLLLDG